MTRKSIWLVSLLSLVALLFGVAVGTTAAADVLEDPIVDLGRGPVTVNLPPNYDPGTPAPLVLVLHGYSADSAYMDAWLQLGPVADAYGFIYVTPDGTEDLFGLQFWNATDACCAFFSQPDDSGYLATLIDAVKQVANVDDQRVYLIGHSNGGFMSYRMACDHAATIAAIVSIAGATWLNPADCDPAAPVHTLQIHGDADSVISFGGGCLFGGCYPGVRDTVRQWATFNGCARVVDTSSPPIDVDQLVPGNETVIARIANGCDVGGSAELWRIRGGSHSPQPSATFGTLVFDYLVAHPQTTQ